MYIYHNSQEEKYRMPQGAVKTGEMLRLSLKVEADLTPDKVEIRLWNGTEFRISMKLENEEDNLFWYSAELKTPDTPQLLWYYFEVFLGGRCLFYSNNSKRLGGVGVMEETPSYNSYQITVYDKDFKTPDWFKNAIMYQIFPDRFYREGDFCDFRKRRGAYKIHEDWYENFFFDKHPFEEGPACNDFYGGNLKGIEKKLNYLKELGISAIYLNPIFEAFSNHRYDTGDYSKIDSFLGSEDDFKRLCETAKDMGIRIILDGVFSHTGSDSVYFNKYGNYGENTGVMRDKNSPYASWYKANDDGLYSSWWGCSNLINVSESEPTYIDYILKGDDAIIKKWIRLGASGWRLDVADELPDDFIKVLRSEVKNEKSDALIIGEVWEDASNKVSYGERREYLYGHELDGVMNYPFKNGVLGFLLGEKSAGDFAAEMNSIMENYPKEALYASMNLIGSHDTPRAKTVLSGKHIDNSLTLEKKQDFRVEGRDETLALKRLSLAAFIQMTFVGVPCIYYGDEIGMQGLADPFNRRPYSWRSIDPQLFNWYKRLTTLRNETDALKAGDFEFLYANDSVIVYKREIKNERDVFGNIAKKGTLICCVNAGYEPCEFNVELKEKPRRNFKAVLGGGMISQKGNLITIKLKEYGAEIFKTE